MNQILRTHLLSLEGKVQELHDELTSPTTSPEAISSVKKEIQFRQDTVEKLRRAIEFEQQFPKGKSPAKPRQRRPDAAAQK